MKITDVEAIVLIWPPPDRDYWTALRPIGRVNELLVRVHTAAGFYGIGEAHSSGQGFAGLYRQSADGAMHADGASRAVATCSSPCWLVATRSTTNGCGTRCSASATRLAGVHQVSEGRKSSPPWPPLTLPLWDIKGKAANLPVYKLLGGYDNSVPCYVTGGYYQDGKSVSDLVNECETYVDMGYEAIKLKIGHVSLAEDYERVSSVRSAVGPGIHLMVDVNEGWDVNTAITGARMLEPLNIRWLEEPVHWYDRVDGLGKVVASTSIPIASGENAVTRWDARDLIHHGGVKVMQYDSTRNGGITECLRIAGLCAAENVRLGAPSRPTGARTHRSWPRRRRDLRNLPQRRPGSDLGRTVHRAA